MNSSEDVDNAIKAFRSACKEFTEADTEVCDYLNRHLRAVDRLARAREMLKTAKAALDLATALEVA